MRYKGINLLDLADKTSTEDAKCGLDLLKAQPEVPPKAPEYKSGPVVWVKAPVCRCACPRNPN